MRLLEVKSAITACRQLLECLRVAEHAFEIVDIPAVDISTDDCGDDDDDDNDGDGDGDDGDEDNGIAESLEVDESLETESPEGVSPNPPSAKMEAAALLTPAAAGLERRRVETIVAENDLALAELGEMLSGQKQAGCVAVVDLAYKCHFT